MSEAFIGEWDLESSENFPEYLADVGVSRVLRAMATAAKPTIHISIDVRHKIFHSRRKFPFKMLCYSLVTLDIRQKRSLTTLHILSLDEKPQTIYSAIIFKCIKFF